MPVTNIDSGYSITDVSGSDTKYPSIEVGSIRKAIDTGSDGDGIAEFVYLKGVASTAAADWVSYDEVGQTTRLTNASVGNVAVAMAATVADKWGWYQISGNALALVEATVSADVALFASETAATAQDDASDGDVISGAISRSSNGGGGAGNIIVQLNRPYITQAAGATS